jgi:conjugal transfer mating pair stabilization protein TraG
MVAKEYGWGNTTKEVHNSISNSREHIQADRAGMEAVNHAANNSSAMTSSINHSSFSVPHSDAPVQEPNGEAVLVDAKNLRSYNRNEEVATRSSRIRTTPPGMIKEGVENVFQGQGLVDSQTKRATSEGFFDKPPPGPIPKNAPSTLSKK